MMSPSLVINNNKKIRISFVIYLFLYIFAPPLLPRVNFIIVLSLYSLIMIFTKYKRQAKRVFIESNLHLFTVLFLVSLVYLAFIMFLGTLLDPVNITNYAKTLYRFFLLAPVTISCILYLILRCKELDYGFQELIKGLIYASLIQAIFSIMMAVSTEFKNFILRIVYLNTGDELSQNLWQLQRRYFAFSQNVLDTFGYGTGILSVLPIFYGLYTKKYAYFLYTPILLIIPLLNSRTGLIIAFIGLVIFSLNFILKSSPIEVLKAAVFVTVLISISTSAMDYIKESHPVTMEWVQSGIDDTVGFLKGEKGSDSVTVITSSEKWYISESPLLFLFGTGHTVYGADGYFHTDVGYVNDLWLMGLVGIILLYIPLLYMFFRAIKYNNNFLGRLLLLFLLVSFLVTNIKTIIFSYNVGTSVLLLLLFFIIYSNGKKSTNESLLP